MFTRTRPLPFAAALVAILLASWAFMPKTTAAQTNGTPERFTALAANPNASSPVRAARTVEIVVARWSSDAERDRLMTVLFEKGADKLLDVLQDTPKVGYIRTPGSLAWELHYARRTDLPDGGEQVTLVTDRPISFYEASTQARTMDYPFTLIDLRLKSDGTGEGKMSLATKITADRESRTIELENWDAQPVLLQGVKREEGF
jgi:hypothetical protein